MTEVHIKAAQVEGKPQSEYAYNRDYPFWSIIVALCTMRILCSLENTAVLTTIIKELDLGNSYI